jgi:hypothetical protein
MLQWQRLWAGWDPTKSSPARQPTTSLRSHMWPAGSAEPIGEG